MEGNVGLLGATRRQNQLAQFPAEVALQIPDIEVFEVGGERDGSLQATNHIDQIL